MKLGLISGFKKVIGKLKPSGGDGGFIYNMLKPLKNLVPENQALHPMNLGKIRYNYCGPFNDLQNGEPTNSTDSVCKNHDYAYENAFNAPKNQQKGLIRQADLTMLDELKTVQPQDFSERLGKGIAWGGISAKIALENAGSRIGLF